MILSFIYLFTARLFIRASYGVGQVYIRFPRPRFCFPYSFVPGAEATNVQNVVGISLSLLSHLGFAELMGESDIRGVNLDP